jgi:hypothetical protein
MKNCSPGHQPKIILQTETLLYISKPKRSICLPGPNKSFLKLCLSEKVFFFWKNDFIQNKFSSMKNVPHFKATGVTR